MRGDDTEAEPRLPRRERERQRHRQEILDAARKVLAARGVEGVTVEEVAREAEFAVGSVYRYFRSKEELLDLVLVELAQPLLEELEALPESGLAFEPLLAAYVNAVVRHATEDLPVFQAFAFAPGSMPVPGSEARERMIATWRRYLEAVRRVLEVGQREGALAPGELLAPSLALAGLVYTFTRWSLVGSPNLPEPVTALVLRAFLDGHRAAGR